MVLPMNKRLLALSVARRRRVHCLTPTYCDGMQAGQLDKSKSVSVDSFFECKSSSIVHMLPRKYPKLSHV